MVTSQVMDTTIWVQILGEAVCISHSTSTFGKGVNSTIYPSDGKIEGQIGLFNLGMFTSLGGGKHWI